MLRLPISTWRWLLLALLAVAPGLAMRWRASPEPFYANSDAAIYRTIALALETEGWSGLQRTATEYRGRMRRPEQEAKLPPTRWLYPALGCLWKRAVFGSAPPTDLLQPEGPRTDPMWVSLRRVASLVSCLMLLAAGVFTARMLGPGVAVGVLAVLGCAPLEIHMGQHALVDGLVGFWSVLALGALWEALRNPARSGWLVLLGVSLFALVLTKETALFVYLGLGAVLLANRWAHWGVVTPRLLGVMLTAPLAAVAVLMAQCGGPGAFVEVFQLFTAKALQLDYAIETQDGPWYRYLVDLLVVSPLVFCLALGAAFRAGRSEKPYLFLLGFVAVSFLPMANLRYGLNFRFATIWDWPLRTLAVGQMCWLFRGWSGRLGRGLLVVAVAFLALYDLRQYLLLFMANALYELPTELLLRAVKILK